MTILSIQSSLDSEAISQAAERRLRESPYFFLKGIACRVEDGVATIIGRVPFDQLRQFAEAIVLRVEGVREVINRVEVYDPQRASA